MIYPSIPVNIVFTLHCIALHPLLPALTLSLFLCLPVCFIHSLRLSFSDVYRTTKKWTCSILFYRVCNACVQNAKNWSYPNIRKLTRPTYGYIAYPHYFLAWCNLNIVVAAAAAADSVMAFGVFIRFHSSFVAFFLILFAILYAMYSVRVRSVDCLNVYAIHNHSICLYSTAILPSVPLPPPSTPSLPLLLLLLTDQRK